MAFSTNSERISSEKRSISRMLPDWAEMATPSCAWTKTSAPMPVGPSSSILVRESVVPTFSTVSGMSGYLAFQSSTIFSL